MTTDLVLRRRLDLYTQCQWILQGLPERVVMEIFYRHDIDLEDGNGLDFEDLLKRALVILDAWRFWRISYKSKKIDPPIRLQTVQGAVCTVQEDIPVARIHVSQIGEVKAGEVNSGAKDCILISDPSEDFYEDLGTWFTDSKPGDEKVGGHHVDSVTVVEPIWRYHRPWKIHTQPR